MPRVTEGQFALGGLAALAIWTLVILPLLYYPRQETPHGDRQAALGEQNADSVGDTPPAFATLKLFTAAGRNEIAAYCGRERQNESDDWARKYVCDIKITDAYLALFNFLLVLVTGGLIAVGYFTIRKMRITEELQLRAYIAIDGGFVQLNQNGTVTFTVSVKNSGQTPAYEFRSWSSMEIATAPPFARRGESNIASIVGPGSLTHFGGAMNPAPALLNAVTANQQAIYVWGYVTYRDIFKRRRLFNYRCTMQGPTQTLSFPNGTTGMGWALRPDESGYDAD